MIYVFAYHRSNTDNYNSDCLVDILPSEGVFHNSRGNFGNPQICVSYLESDDINEVEQFKRDRISKAEFEIKYGKVPYP